MCVYMFADYWSNIMNKYSFNLRQKENVQQKIERLVRGLFRKFQRVQGF